jgi:sensor histidine kinase YesM
MRNKKRFWTWQLVGWLTYLSASLFMSSVSVRVIVQRILICAVGILIIQILRVLISRRGWSRLPMPALLPRLVPACVVLALLMEGFTVFVITAIPDSTIPRSLQPRAILANVFGFVAALLIWSLIYIGFHYVARYENAEVERWRMESAVKDAELKALKSQMNPHFIFNCLNSIRALIVEDPERAQTVVTQLANILRYSLQSGNAETVKLEEELQIVKEYLALEKTRLEDRLQIIMQIDPASRSALIPPMLLQTLVENGIKYGIATQPNGGRISLVSRVQDGMLHIHVTNTGQLQRSSNSDGFGLANTKERLKLLCGDAASLSLEEMSPNEVTANLTIPLGAAA